MINPKQRIVTIEWCAFSGVRFAGAEPIAKKTVLAETFGNVSDEEMCEMFFKETNVYEGPLWDGLQPLPDDRSHTALSVGDRLTINGRRYEIAAMGFKRLHPAL